MKALRVLNNELVEVFWPDDNEIEYVPIAEFRAKHPKEYQKVQTKNKSTASQFLHLQDKINKQIDKYGEANEADCNKLEAIADSLDETESDKVINAIKVRSTLLREGFKQISICDLTDYIEAYKNINFLDISWEEEAKVIVDFCKEHNLYLYEKPREDYFEFEGITHAIDNKYNGVVLSNLS
jgi:hypothetical protein